MSSLTPRDLKDITDLVSRKLELYLNIDERERKFDPEGYHRVSPRMHKYDVMYRLLESTEFEKSLKTTPRSRSRNNQSGNMQEQKPRSQSRNKEIKQTEEKSRSSLKSTFTPRSHQSNQPKTRPKSSMPNEIKNKSAEKKSTTPKSTQDSLSKRYQYRPIAIKTPRSTNKQSKRIEQYANEVYDNHPVQELQKLHNVCPKIPNNGKVQNYTKHVGAALNTKNYMDFYLKTGLDGNKTSPRQQAREISNKGSVSLAANDRCSRNSNESSNSPQVDSSRAVVTFKSPSCSGSSETNYKIINIREETTTHSSSTTLYDDQCIPDGASLLPEKSMDRYADQYPKSPRESGNPGDRCKSRIGRKSSSLKINYNSDSEDLSISSSNNELNVDKDTSTRTNSPMSTQESLDTPSSYQEIDSSDSSNSSVLRYYRLSTGEVYSPRRTKSPGAEKTPLQVDNGKKHKKSSTTLTPRKSPERRKKHSNSAQRAKPNLDDSSSSCSSSCPPRYTLLGPSPRLLKRSSIRSDSVREESSDSPRSSTPFQPHRSHRPKTSVKRSKQLIDLNLTAILNRERSEMSITGTWDDEVFVDVDEDLESEELRRASESATSTQSRGICDESDNESKHSLSKEEYYKLEKDGATTPLTDRCLSPLPPRPRFLVTPVKENAVCEAFQDVTTYSTAETVPLPEKSVIFDSKEFSVDDAETPRGEENIPISDHENSVSLKNLSNTTEEIRSNENDTIQESQISGSDAEYLSRGSDGYRKDGRGNRRKRSATRRPVSRGSQWEDEWPKNGNCKPKYFVGSDLDERGDYQYLPENRGNFNEKGYSESESEYYITTEYNPSKNVGSPSPSSQEPCKGIPPKSRTRTAINMTHKQVASSSPLSNESRGDTGSPLNSVYLSQSEVYKAISNLTEAKIDFNKDYDSGPYTPETTSCAPEEVKLYNFLLGSDSSATEAVRGEFSSSCPATQSDILVITKPYQEETKLETSLVYDMQEKPDEFRGRVDTESIIPDEPSDDKENVLDRGLSRASSVTSTLSWSDKYSSSAHSEQKGKPSEIIIDSQHVEKSSEDVIKDQGVSTFCHDIPTTSQRDIFDEDVLNDLKKFYTKRKDDKDDQYYLDHNSESKIKDMMSQLELLVKAKHMHLDKISSGEEFSSVRGGDSDTEILADQLETEIPTKPNQQYSKLIENLIQSAPQMSSDQGSTNESNTSESDSTTDREPNTNYKRSSTLTTRAIVHKGDVGVKSLSFGENVTDAADGVNFKLHQSSFLETALGISGDVTECVGNLSSESKPKQERTHLTEKDIIVLKSPTLAVAKMDEGQILDCKTTTTPQKKLNKKVLERGKLQTTSRRPRSAAARSSKPSIGTRKRPKSSVYLSA